MRASYQGEPQEWTYSQIEGKVQLGDDAVKSTGIEIRTVGPRQMVTTLEVPGEIKPDANRVTRVVPRLSGVVTEVLKQVGDSVREGELLAVLSSRELADAKSTYLESAQRTDFSLVKLAREESLWKRKISAEQDYLEAKRVVEQAQLTQTVAAQKLVALGFPESNLDTLAKAPVGQLSRYEIRASLKGTVIERDVNVGEAVPAEKSLFVTTDLSNVWVEGSISAKDLNAVYEGQPATVVSTDLGREINGRVTYIGSLVGTETRTAPTRVVIPNLDGKWRPGLFVAVRFVTRSSTIPLAVPTDAIQTFRDWQVVFVRSGDWFEGRPLELGRSDGKWVEVLKGLSPGEKYAATNSFAIKAEIGKLGATHDH
ncbi:MAG: efflux RND transporter periplasmic adaptor subunit [Bryobacterales bacterium]|nr:efflux RND transporter periplasmic adaptor subunit [Bryobacterales bacterium]